MNKIKTIMSGGQTARPAFRPIPDSRNNSLDTSSSMVTAETDMTCHTIGECSSMDFPDCPFALHKMYAPIAEMFKSSLGLIYLAQNRETGDKVVVKLIDRGASVTRTVAAELLIHRQCAAHPFVAHLLDVFLTPRHVAIVLEHIPDGDLLEYVNAKRGLQEREARALFQQLVVGMAFLHNLGANNREMKLEDKFLVFPSTSEEEDGPTNATSANGGCAPIVEMTTDGFPALKMQGFLYSKSDQINSDPQSALGSLPYTAPEVLSNSMTEGCAADVWALGVALFKMTTGLYPFERAEDGHEPRRAVQAVLGRIARVEYVIPDSLSPDLQDLLARMLVRQPTKRLTMDGIACHPWFLSYLPVGMTEVNIHAAKNADSAAPIGEDALRAIIAEAQQPLRGLDSDNIDDMADEILNEEEADDLLDELTLG